MVFEFSVLAARGSGQANARERAGSRSSWERQDPSQDSRWNTARRDPAARPPPICPALSRLLISHTAGASVAEAPAEVAATAIKSTVFHSAGRETQGNFQFRAHAACPHTPPLTRTPQLGTTKPSLSPGGSSIKFSEVLEGSSEFPP